MAQAPDTDQQFINAATAYVLQLKNEIVIWKSVEVIWVKSEPSNSLILGEKGSF